MKEQFDDKKLEYARNGLLERINQNNGEFSEMLTLDVNVDEQNLTISPLFVVMGSESRESLLNVAQVLQNRFPDLEFDFEIDPAGQSIKYTVRVKLS